MPDFVLRVEGEYSVVFEAPDIETAVLLAQVNDEWDEPRSALICAQLDSNIQLPCLLGGR